MKEGGQAAALGSVWLVAPVVRLRWRSEEARVPGGDAHVPDVAGVEGGGGTMQLSLNRQRPDTPLPWPRASEVNKIV